MSKKKNRKHAKKATRDTAAIASAAIAMFEALPGASQVLKPLRRLAKATGYARLIAG